MTEELTIKTYNEGGEWLLVLAGCIDERAVLPRAAGSLPLRINLKDVTYINSSGIRIWCLWMKEQLFRSQITLEHCPVSVAKHFGSIYGLLEKNVTVQSIYVPYFSEITGERKDVLFRMGENFDGGDMLAPPEVRDSKGNLMEMDVMDDVYFRFVRK